MLLLLHVQHRPVRECPLHDVGLRRCFLYLLTLGELGPEDVKVLKLDEMPYVGEWGRDDSGFADGSRCGDTRRHRSTRRYVAR